MDQPKDFRSTVLQAPSRHDGEDRDRRHDLSSIVAPPPVQAPPPAGHSSFSLRSPTQTSDFQHPHHPSSYSSSPRDHRSPPRPQAAHPAGLSHPSNPYGSSTLPALHHQAAPPPLSPLHPPSGAYYPPPESRDRDKSAGPASTSKSGSYYDPLTDSTRERRVSDAASRYPASSSVAQPGSPPKVCDQLFGGRGELLLLTLIVVFSDCFHYAAYCTPQAFFSWPICTYPFLCWPGPLLSTPGLNDTEIPPWMTRSQKFR